MQAVVNVVDQYGNPIQGASIRVDDGDYGTVANGTTDANGQWLTPDFPSPSSGAWVW